MDSSEIDLESLQAVKSLKSKFERMALETASIRTSTVESSSSRPRATSSSIVNTPPEDLLNNLRASSSSSDLKLPLKRPPPPPPPPRGAKAVAQSPTPSASVSPLLRPVPIPPAASLKEINSLNSVSSLKSKFTPSLPPGQVQSTLSLLQPEARLAVPLRSPAPKSPDELNSPFSDDEETNESVYSSTSPPPIPVRQKLFANLQNSSSNRQLGSESSLTSVENESNPIPQRAAARPSPPPPPPRSTNSLEIEPNQIPQLSLIPPPPPPPPRSTRPPVSPSRAGGDSHAKSVPIPTVSSPPPSLPVRRNTNATHEQPSPPTAERKALGSSRLPPPPTRTIGLGDKLPPPRFANSPSSDEDSGGEEDEPNNLLPDGTSSSRQPPTLVFREGHAEPKVHVHAHSGCVALSGSHAVVAHNHHIKIYDLMISDTPLFDFDIKDLGIKECKATCMEFRQSSLKSDRGYLLWIGTKEGHVFELDARTGGVRGTKYAAHLHPITHLFRHGRSMISLDETGKALIFSSDPDTLEDAGLLGTLPRAIRTTDKYDFAKLVDGKLWMASRSEQQCGASPTQKLPVVRIFDIFNPSSTGRMLLPTEHAGPVTSATIIPSEPRRVYVGHEEGFVSIWELDTEDGYPQCIEVMKVSTSDVLCMEGVNDRLWAGSRNGMISAFDVSQKPCVVTNCWIAHPGLPVLRLLVNHWGIVKVGRFCVASVGRDEQLRLWDGLLGNDWVEKELVKLETSFSTFRHLTVLVMSWNCDSARPDSLTGDPENVNLLHNVLHSIAEPPDVIVFGFQEVIDLESRKMAAKNVLLGGNSNLSKKHKPANGETDPIGAGLSEKVTGAYRRWYDYLVMAVRSSIPSVAYSVVGTESLVGLFSCVFVKSKDRASGVFDDVAVTTIKRGMGGRYGNKGGIVCRFVVGDSSFCFINCHLAAGQNAVRRRNADIAGMLEDKNVFEPSNLPLAYIGGGDGSMVLDHEFVILNGDMNYRIDHRRDTIVAAIHSGDLASLLSHDQLLREIKSNRGCRLRGFSEGPLSFAPTYKYDPRSNEYDTSEKRRAPAWCDRVLWRSEVPARVKQLSYERYEANVSDHRPISAAFQATVKIFDRRRRGEREVEVCREWDAVQESILEALLRFYVGQELIVVG